MGDLLRPGGRLILDIYHPGYFAAQQGERTVERDGRAITISERLDDNRLSVNIDYGSDVAPDRMEWELYTPEAIQAIAARHRLRTVLVCALSDETRPPTSDVIRMQLVFERE
jgi:hypothetical protein